MAESKRIGKYEILGEAGRGGFAVVYRARDTELGRIVALKVLHPRLTTDPKFIQRFHQEARTAAGLHHPHIVTIYEVGEEAGQNYLAMEFLSGQPLSRLLESGPLPVEQAISIVEQVARALEAVHQQKLVHRDVKPSNIMVNDAGQPTLMDFGIVRAAEGTRLTTTMAVLGTPEYMAPEQAEIEEAAGIDWRADIYSLGVVAYEMLVGRPPFTGKSPTAILHKHVYEPPPVPTTLNPDLPAGLEPILLKALAKRREDRFQQAGTFAAQLRHALLTARQMQQQEAQLRPLYERVQAAASKEDWAEVLALGGQIQALDPDYQDVPELMAHASGHLRRPTRERPARRAPIPTWRIVGLSILVVLVCAGSILGLNQFGIIPPPPPTTLTPTGTPIPTKPTPVDTPTPTEFSQEEDADSDDDGMPDDWEVDYGLDSTNNDASDDSDGDGLSNLEEYDNDTNPKDSDSDDDGMLDGWEVGYGLDPTTDDASDDSDGDGLSNLEEYDNDTNPKDSDSDDDGMLDGWEVGYGLDPTTNDASNDPDSDGMSNLQEHQNDTYPHNPDSDGDGILDGADDRPLEVSLPDLTVTGITLVENTIGCSYQNKGGVEIPEQDVWIEIYIGGEQNSRSNIGVGRTFRPGVEGTLQTPVRLDVSGMVEVKCVIDADNGVAEASEGNNELVKVLELLPQLEVSLPDLTVTDITLVENTISCSYQNKGGVEVPEQDVWIEIYIGGEQNSRSNIGVGRTFRPGVEGTLQTPVRLDVSGMVEVKCVIDADNGVAEANEGNNELVKVLELLP